MRVEISRADCRKLRLHQGADEQGGVRSVSHRDPVRGG